MQTKLRFCAAVALGAAVLTRPLVVSAAQAEQKVGVAAAVKPDATSQPPGGDSSTLKIGKSVVYNERIDTSSSGQVQVLLLDGSTFTVGPGSSLRGAAHHYRGYRANEDRVPPGNHGTCGSI
jgi:hypothetical protein